MGLSPRDVLNLEVEGVIESYELVLRMRMLGVLDLSRETAATKWLYDMTDGSVGRREWGALMICG